MVELYNTKNSSDLQASDQQSSCSSSEERSNEQSFSEELAEQLNNNENRNREQTFSEELAEQLDNNEELVSQKQCFSADRCEDCKIFKKEQTKDVFCAQGSKTLKITELIPEKVLKNKQQKCSKGSMLNLHPEK